MKLSIFKTLGLVVALALFQGMVFGFSGNMDPASGEMTPGFSPTGSIDLAPGKSITDMDGTKDKAETLAKKRLYIKENFLDPIN